MIARNSILLSPNYLAVLCVAHVHLGHSAVDTRRPRFRDAPFVAD